MQQYIRLAYRGAFVTFLCYIIIIASIICVSFVSQSMLAEIGQFLTRNKLNMTMMNTSSFPLTNIIFTFLVSFIPSLFISLLFLIQFSRYRGDKPLPSLSFAGSIVQVILSSYQLLSTLLLTLDIIGLLLLLSLASIHANLLFTLTFWLPLPAGILALIFSIIQLVNVNRIRRLTTPPIPIQPPILPPQPVTMYYYPPQPQE